MIVALSFDDLLDRGDIHPCKTGEVYQREAKSVALADKLRLGAGESGVDRLFASGIAPVGQFMRLILGVGDPLKVLQSAVRGIAVQVRTNPPRRTSPLECLQHGTVQPDNCSVTTIMDGEGKILTLPVWQYRGAFALVFNMTLTRNFVVRVRERRPNFHSKIIADLRACRKDESAVDEVHAPKEPQP